MLLLYILAKGSVRLGQCPVRAFVMPDCIRAGRLDLHMGIVAILSQLIEKIVGLVINFLLQMFPRNNDTDRIFIFDMMGGAVVKMLADFSAKMARNPAGVLCSR